MGGGGSSFFLRRTKEKNERIDTRGGRRGSFSFGNSQGYNIQFVLKSGKRGGEKGGVSHDSPRRRGHI